MSLELNGRFATRTYLVSPPSTQITRSPSQSGRHRLISGPVKTYANEPNNFEKHVLYYSSTNLLSRRRAAHSTCLGAVRRTANLWPEICGGQTLLRVGPPTNRAPSTNLVWMRGPRQFCEFSVGRRVSVRISDCGRRRPDCSGALAYLHRSFYVRHGSFNLWVRLEREFRP